MGKLLLVSILFVTVLLPAKVARDPDPIHGLRRLVVYLGLADFAYLIAVAVLYQRFQ